MLTVEQREQGLAARELLGIECLERLANCLDLSRGHPLREFRAADRVVRIVTLAQHVSVAARGDGETAVAVDEKETLLVDVVLEMDRPVVDFDPQRSSENGQVDPPLERRLGRLEIDVEIGREFALPSPFQDIHPPTVVISRHADMVGHDVDDQPHATGPQRLRERAKSRFAAERRAHRHGIDAVVAMHGARARRHDRRRIDMAQTHRREVVDETLGVGEGEFVVKLQAYRGAGRHGTS